MSWIARRRLGRHRELQNFDSSSRLLGPVAGVCPPDLEWTTLPGGKKHRLERCKFRYPLVAVRFVLRPSEQHQEYHSRCDGAQRFGTQTTLSIQHLGINLLVTFRMLCHGRGRGAFVRSGLTLPMSAGAVAMSLSTVIVELNAQLPRRLQDCSQELRLYLCNTPTEPVTLAPPKPIRGCSAALGLAFFVRRSCGTC